LIDKGFLSRVATKFSAATTLTCRAKHQQDVIVAAIGSKAQAQAESRSSLFRMML